MFPITNYIKADVGSVAGHLRPHPKMMAECRRILSDGVKRGTMKDFYMTGMSTGAAEMTFEEKKSEPLILLMADKTEPSAFSNLNPASSNVFEKRRRCSEK